MNWAFRTMIVPSQYTPLASQLSALLAGASGEDMFTTGLSASGTPPATHYVSTGYVSEGYAAVLPLDTYTTNWGSPSLWVWMTTGWPVCGSISVV